MAKNIVRKLTKPKKFTPILPHPSSSIPKMSELAKRKMPNFSTFFDECQKNSELLKMSDQRISEFFLRIRRFQRLKNGGMSDQINIRMGIRILRYRKNLKWRNRIRSEF